jgi:hypothetical protein
MKIIIGNNSTISTSKIRRENYFDFVIRTILFYICIFFCLRSLYLNQLKVLMTKFLPTSPLPTKQYLHFYGKGEEKF